MKQLLSLTLAFLSISKPFVSAFSYAEACTKTCVTGPNIACEAETIQLCNDGIMINFDDAEIEDILSKHNIYRNDIATGAIAGYSTATRMGRMRWDAELTAMIDLNIKKCNFAYDSCSRTVNYPLSGQNLGDVKDQQYSLYDRNDAITAIGNIIGDWFAQNANANMNIIRKYQDNVPNVKNFTNMVVGKSARIGCAAVWYPEDGVGRINFGCNYAQGSLNQMPIYVVGPTASQCISTDTLYSGLCSSSEPYSYNTSF